MSSLDELLMGLCLGHMTIEPIHNTPTQIIESIAGPGYRRLRRLNLNRMWDFKARVF